MEFDGYEYKELNHRHKDGTPPPSAEFLAELRGYVEKLREAWLQVDESRFSEKYYAGVDAAHLAYKELEQFLVANLNKLSRERWYRLIQEISETGYYYDDLLFTNDGQYFDKLLKPLLANYKVFPDDVVNPKYLINRCHHIFRYSLMAGLPQVIQENIIEVYLAKLDNLIAYGTPKRSIGITENQIPRWYLFDLINFVVNPGAGGTGSPGFHFKCTHENSTYDLSEAFQTKMLKQLIKRYLDEHIEEPEFVERFTLSPELFEKFFYHLTDPYLQKEMLEFVAVLPKVAANAKHPSTTKIQWAVNLRDYAKTQGWLSNELAQLKPKPIPICPWANCPARTGMELNPEIDWRPFPAKLTYAKTGEQFPMLNASFEYIWRLAVGQTFSPHYVYEDTENFKVGDKVFIGDVNEFDPYLAQIVSISPKDKLTIKCLEDNGIIATDWPWYTPEDPAQREKQYAWWRAHDNFHSKLHHDEMENDWWRSVA
jgi:hypothetical protein